jgi:uncharacterized protein
VAKAEVPLSVLAGIREAWANRTPAADAVFDDQATLELITAAQKHDQALTTRLAEEGEVDDAGRGGATPLMWTMRRDDLEAARMLLVAGADPNLTAEDGAGAMTLAATANDERFVVLLLGHGGDPNAVDGGGNPVAHTALEQLWWPSVEALLNAGADIDARNGFGNTLLLLAGMLNQYDMVAKLLARGADPSLANKTGGTLRVQLDRGALDAKSEQGQWRERVRAILDAEGPTA